LKINRIRTTQSESLEIPFQNRDEKQEILDQIGEIPWYEAKRLEIETRYHGNDSGVITVVYALGGQDPAPLFERLLKNLS
jgi:hypothetical protein